MKYDPKYDGLLSAKDAMRKAFFEVIGDLARWRGKPKKFKNKKKEKNKQKCRLKNLDDQ